MGGAVARHGASGVGEAGGQAACCTPRSAEVGDCGGEEKHKCRGMG